MGCFVFPSLYYWVDTRRWRSCGASLACAMYMQSRTVYEAIVRYECVMDMFTHPKTKKLATCVSRAYGVRAAYTRRTQLVLRLATCNYMERTPETCTLGAIRHVLQVFLSFRTFSDMYAYASTCSYFSLNVHTFSHTFAHFV